MILVSRSTAGLPPLPRGLVRVGERPGAIIHCTGNKHHARGLKALISRWRVVHVSHTSPKRLEERDGRMVNVGGNGWATIGYNFGVGEDEDGETVILEGCGADVRGAHAKGHNRKLGIVVFGNGSSLSMAEMVGIEHLVETYCAGKPVIPHKRVSTRGKTCPGPVVTTWVEQRWPAAVGV